MAEKTLVLRENAPASGVVPEYVLEWYCEVPPDFAVFRITEQEWSFDHEGTPVRKIFAWEES
jgi:hypothetical protein